MNRGGAIVDVMGKLITLFASHSEDGVTLDELKKVLSDRRQWRIAHDLFDRIRVKSLATSREKNTALDAQYRFEEICAKTIYNLSAESAPFDPDSPFWIVPDALALARALRIDEREVLSIVAA